MSKGTRKYRAATMAEVLAEVKRDLGRDAVILRTRSVRKGGLLGLGGRRVWEVTALPAGQVPARAQGSYVPVAGSAGKGQGPAGRAAPVPVEAPGPPTSAQPVYQGQGAGSLAEQVREIRLMLEALLEGRSPQPPSSAGLRGELGAFRAHLIGQDVAEPLADAIIEQAALGLTGQQAGDRQAVRRQIAALVAERIRAAGSAASAPPAPPPADRGRVVAFIGPTGVGKTTTIAKLAANAKLREGKRVGLITIDTYRIAAVDQLRTYADIIDVPLRTVLTAGELHQAVQEMRELDLVLIDTAGRSQNNRLRLQQLRSVLAAAQADEVYLVLSATSNRLYTQSVVERFLPVGANRLIITKLDEAATFGVILNCVHAGVGMLSYVTTGQDVPDDIAPADADALAECILSGRFGGIVDAA